MLYSLRYTEIIFLFIGLTKMEPITVSGLSVGELAYKTLQTNIGKIGRIIGIFHQTCHLHTLEDTVISVTRSDVPEGPLNVTTNLDSNRSFIHLGLKLNDTAIFHSMQLRLGKDILCVDLEEPKIWSTSPFSQGLQLSPPEIQRNLAILTDLIQTAQKKIEIKKNFDFKPQFLIHIPAANEKPNSEIFQFLKLKDAIVCQNLNRIHHCTESLVGKGPGLTPMMDDILVGLIAGMIFTAPKFFFLKSRENSILSSILRGSANTTRLSHNFIKAAMQGQINKPVYNLIENVICQSAIDLDKNASTVFNLGATSGYATAYGIIQGVEIGLELNTRQQ